jgi:hypothetical protein
MPVIKEGVSYLYEPSISDDLKMDACRIGWRPDEDRDYLASSCSGAFMGQPVCRDLWAYFVGMAGAGRWKEHPAVQLDPYEMLSEAMCDEESVMARYGRIPQDDLLRCAKDELRWCHIIPLELKMRHCVYDESDFGPDAILKVAAWCMVLWRMLGVDAICPVVDAALHWERMRRAEAEERRRRRANPNAIREVEIPEDRPLGTSCRDYGIWDEWDAVTGAMADSAGLLGMYDYCTRWD